MKSEMCFSVGLQSGWPGSYLQGVQGSFPVTGSPFPFKQSEASGKNPVSQACVAFFPFKLLRFLIVSQLKNNSNNNNT